MLLGLLLHHSAADGDVRRGDGLVTKEGGGKGRLSGVPTLHGQSRIQYSLPLPGFSKSEIHLASATGRPLGFLWTYVLAFIKSAKKLDSACFSSLRGLPT